MVHPSQQGTPYRRKPLPCITITWNGRSRTFCIRPWFSGFALTLLILLSAGYLGAAGYLVYRDDLVGAAITRQVEMQYAYEERIAALRSELDRVTSRHLVKTLGVEEQLAVLLDRQDLIERRQSALDEIVGKAGATGVDVADTIRTPRPRPGAEPAAAPADAEPLAYAPAAPADDVITGTLIRDADGDQNIRLANVRPILAKIRSSLDAAQTGQEVALYGLAAATERELEALSSALAPLGVNLQQANTGGPEGGPFIPATGLHFVERTTLLGRALDDLAALRARAASLPLRMPLRAERISSSFGYRMDPFLRRPAMHAGLDMVAPAGAEVRATAAGTVVLAGWNGGYGQVVEVRHQDGVTTRYGHLSKILVKAGQEVEAGAVIGRVGSTGRSTGPHLHYETRRDDKPVNPAPYLAAGRAL
jgi:murein DD-endopeptidase MepM/ murein hydrolase activator NlpD